MTWKRYSWLCVPLAGILGTLVLVVGGGTLLYGSPALLLARLRGEQLVLRPAVLKLGECGPGAERHILLQLTNLGEQPAGILGGTTTCSCVATQGLPITVPAGETRSVPVTVHVGGEAPEFRQTITLFTDGDQLGTLQAEVRAMVVKRSRSE
ncbi:hypothetical protein Mal4_39260 [Maioricimonas rarisocia]|uniref:DUF1573 domain-containing protein n=1 Tax=Maioricimonas rarisocia TaxID=2528026 RepID=A0A517ZAX5_9PLAN|nr:DUF1573 domain-containing protein [Maioricimonas rarisocia]QDU39581.1 hypothetical protein Mal4_39260 [Maioricimonas rarisocia]